ncbi:hypothetical protein ACN20G_36720 (plasmid) [Streptomyces sp. BI20]|uniref:hypothetical protein n=1 Tax=Streptomyces sp. BI20 TaxID=3403460 RepID=UPI003C77DB29
MAFFAEMPLPFLPAFQLKVALAQAYFESRADRQEREQKAFDAVPPESREGLEADFNWAQVQAALEIRRDPAHVRQMRANLRRLPELAQATRQELDNRVDGVLTTLNRACLPEWDAAAMADLKAAMGFDGPPARSRAAWMHAALCRSEQLAVPRETDGQERFDGLMALETSELLHFRELVLENIAAMQAVASEGSLRKCEIRSLRDAVTAGQMLVEWNSVRQVVEPGSRPAQLTRDALYDLWSICSHVGGGGEGREAFTARTGRAGRQASAPRPPAKNL